MKLKSFTLPARISAVFVVVVAILLGIAVSPAAAAGPPVFSKRTVSFTWLIDVPVTDSVSATGAVSYAITSGSLPTGTSVNTLTGEFGGSPEFRGTALFTVTATSATGETANQEVSIINLAYNEPEWVSIYLPYLTIGKLASGQLIASRATRFDVIAGTLPLGVTLDPLTGVLAGAPTAIERYEVTIRASNAGWIADRVFTGNVASGYPVWVTELLPAFRAGVRVDLQLEAIGAARFTYQDAARLPAGLSLSTSGRITGAPAAAGIYDTEIWAGTTLVNSTGTTWPKRFTGTVLKRLPIWNGTLGSLRVGDPVRRMLPVTGAASYSISSGSLPAGVTLDLATGFCEGTPTTAGAYSVDIVAHTDDGGSTSSTLSGNVVVAAPTWNVSKLPALRVGSPIPTTQLTTSAERLTLVSGALPSGLTLDYATGELSGTPTVAGRYSVTLNATNDGGSASAWFSGGVVDAFRGAIKPGFVVGDVVEGAEFDIAVTDADAGSPYAVELHSTPVVVGAGIVSATGAATQTMALPNVPGGAHTIVLKTVVDGVPVTTNLWFFVNHQGNIVAMSTAGPVTEPLEPVPAPSQNSGALPVLGIDILPIGILAMVLLGCGIVMRLGGRRNQQG